MQKSVCYVLALFIITSIAACGGGGSSATVTSVYDLPTTFASYSTARPHLMGGAVQGIPLVLNNTALTFSGSAGIDGIGSYSTPNDSPAKFNRPNDITFNMSNSTFYVADYLNNRIRQISSSGIVSTLTDKVTGSDLVFNRPSGISTDGSKLYVVNSGLNTISIFDIASNAVTTIGSTLGLSGSVDSKVPADVRFKQPTGITTDGINLYVTDSGNHTVRRIDIASNAVYTLAGTSGIIGSVNGLRSDARFNQPCRITTDGANLYVTDVGNRTIRKIVIRTGDVTTIAGAAVPVGTDKGTIDGIGTEARFYQPNGITADGANLYVTDSYHNSIRRIELSSGVVTTLNIPGGTLHTPLGITTDGISLFVADTETLNINRTYTYSNSILKIQ